jgi:myo-inositol 2-dehydrogenase/D-chiro-inositol 1-dehydrogenase
MNQKLNIGLIGAGRIGRVHAENLAYRIPEVNLVAISDIYVEAAERLAADFQVPAAYQEHRPVLEDQTIDAIVICSSTDTHA